jgi:hypothetical protein
LAEQRKKEKPKMQRSGKHTKADSTVSASDDVKFTSDPVSSPATSEKGGRNSRMRGKRSAMPAALSKVWSPEMGNWESLSEFFQ